MLCPESPNQGKWTLLKHCGSFIVGWCEIELGRLQEAQDWFKKAILIDDKAVPKAGIDDPDLKQLWDNVRHELDRRGHDAATALLKQYQQEIATDWTAAYHKYVSRTP